MAQYVRLITNFLRYPAVTIAAPFSLLAVVSRQMPFILIFAAILIGVVLLYKFQWFPRILGENTSEGGMTRMQIGVALLFIIVAFWVTMLPTIQFSPTFTTNENGRDLYIPAPWLAVGMSMILFTVFPLRWRIPVLIGVVCTYFLLGLYGNSGFCRAGKISDQLISDYVSYCKAHPGVTPTVVSIIAETEGYSALDDEGLTAAVRYLHPPVPIPEYPLVNIGEFSSGDSITTEFVSDSVIRITDNTRFSWLGIWDDPSIVKRLAGVPVDTRYTKEIQLAGPLPAEQRHYLAIRDNHLVPLE